MRESFYGLLREYLTSLRERDHCEQRVRSLPEGADRDDASQELELAQKRCKALRRDILRHPEVNMRFSAQVG